MKLRLSKEEVFDILKKNNVEDVVEVYTSTHKITIQKIKLSLSESKMTKERFKKLISYDDKSYNNYSHAGSNFIINRYSLKNNKRTHHDRFYSIVDLIIYLPTVYSSRLKSNFKRGLE